MTAFDRILDINSGSAIAYVEAGVSLDALLRAACPLGLWVPVLPGTRQVTVGGAIASDIHGKNHHSSGSFGNHVESLDLLMADGSVRTLTPSGPGADLFWATVGGMGLTGVILRASVRMVRVESCFFIVDNDRTNNLDQTMSLLTDGSDENYTYSVAVPDVISQNAKLGRATFSRGNIARVSELPPRLRRKALRFRPRQFFSVPEGLAIRVVNDVTMRSVSEAAYWAQRDARQDVQSLTKFYQPLDMIGNWNRLYGRQGFLQYQFSVPFGAEHTLETVIRQVAASPHRSFLNVLKRMGQRNPGYLSWPSPGFMLSLDFRVTPGLGKFLDTLDEEIASVGGRLYFAKDSRMKPHLSKAMYPRLDEWRAVRAAADPAGVFASDLARRLGLLG
ncbi:decaprenylphospho-beta-D-ribofuranose 2-oxidase [Mycolicibacterium sp. BK634]|nr:decaprenylphospho-beta-D-ribofuranose 2-oxidase [Mycolicibacterium sp. BK634]